MIDTESSDLLPRRKKLPHEIPSWVPEGSIYYITINCLNRGSNQLALPETASALWETVSYRTAQNLWWPRLFLLMPDHLHALISFNPGHSMRKLIKDWKRFTAKTLGIMWQDGFFEHRIRGGAALDEKGFYIQNNPVRANLVSAPEKWPYVWRATNDSTNHGSLSQTALPNATNLKTRLEGRAFLKVGRFCQKRRLRLPHLPPALLRSKPHIRTTAD